jgi:hypothetical protein
MNPTTIKRLVFAKYLFNQVREQADRSEPFSSIALLSIHDSIELFLQLSTEHVHTHLGAQIFKASIRMDEI